MLDRMAYALSVFFVLKISFSVYHSFDWVFILLGN